MLANDVNAAGGTTVSGGTLQIGNGGATGSLTGSVALNGNNLAFNRTGSLTFAGAVTGGGNIQTSSGTVIFTGTLGTSPSPVSLTVNSGSTAQIGAGATSGAIFGSITDNGALIYNRSDTIVQSDTISGSGTLEKQGTGTLIVTGLVDTAGGTTITAGTLQIGNAGFAGLVNHDIANNGVLAFNHADDVEFNGKISGTGAVNHLTRGNAEFKSNRAPVSPIHIKEEPTLPAAERCEPVRMARSARVLCQFPTVRCWPVTLE